MTERTDSAQGPHPLSRGERARAIASWEAEQKRQREEGMAVLRARRKAEKHERLHQRMVELWPLWVGLLLGMLGPGIQYLALSVGPWCMALVYPFVVLSQRPEIQVGPITHLLPNVILFCQFPIEGWLAQVVLRRHVRPLSVIWQVMLFHSLGVAELWMLSGTAFDLLRR